MKDIDSVPSKLNLGTDNHSIESSALYQEMGLGKVINGLLLNVGDELMRELVIDSGMTLKKLHESTQMMGPIDNWSFKVFIDRKKIKGTRIRDDIASLLIQHTHVPSSQIAKAFLTYSERNKDDLLRALNPEIWPINLVERNPKIIESSLDLISIERKNIHLVDRLPLMSSLFTSLVNPVSNRFSMFLDQETIHQIFSHTKAPAHQVEAAFCVLATHGNIDINSLYGNTSLIKGDLYEDKQNSHTLGDNLIPDGFFKKPILSILSYSSDLYERTSDRDKIDVSMIEPQNRLKMKLMASEFYRDIIDTPIENAALYHIQALYIMAELDNLPENNRETLIKSMMKILEIHSHLEEKILSADSPYLDNSTNNMRKNALSIASRFLKQMRPNEIRHVMQAQPYTTKLLLVEAGADIRYFKDIKNRDKTRILGQDLGI